MTEKKQIALIYGGRGVEHSVSVAGAKNLISLIDKERYGVIPVYISKHGGFSLRSPVSNTDGSPLYPISRDGVSGFLTAEGELIRIDCAFPLLHGDFGEDGTVQGLLTSLGIAFVGCDTVASAICLDKAVTKAVAESLGIPTVSGTLITDALCNADKYDLPVFIKPDRLGSSYGAGMAAEHDAFRRIFAEAHALGGGRVLIEQFKSPVRELECAYFEAQGEKIFSSAGEILCDGFYSYEKKYSDGGAKTSSKATLSSETNDKILEYSERLCSFIGIRHLARIDFFLSDGEIYLNEINTMPGMTETSLYLKLLSEHGISPEEAVNRLISDAAMTGAI